MLLALVAAAAITVPVPPVPRHFVTDTPGLMGAESKARLSAELRAYERETKHQLRVWIWPTRPVHAIETLEAWSYRTFNAWRFGRRSANDGLLLIVFVNPPEQRIVVGRGLEVAVPDREAVRIRRALTADLAAGRADEGITRAAHELMRLAP